MNERVMQFRIGMFVIVAGLVLTMLIVWFGESPSLFRDHAFVKVRYKRGPRRGRGDHRPQERHPDRRGPLDQVRRPARPARRRDRRSSRSTARYKLRKDSVAKISRSLIGDVAIDMLPGSSLEVLTYGDTPTNAPEILGDVTPDPSKALAAATAAFEKVGGTLKAIEAAANGLSAIAKKADHIDEFIATIDETGKNISKAAKGIDRVIADNENNLKPAIANLKQFSDKMAVTFDDETIARFKVTMEKLAAVSTKLDAGLAEIQPVLADLGAPASKSNPYDQPGPVDVLAQPDHRQHQPAHQRPLRRQGEAQPQRQPSEARSSAPSCTTTSTRPSPPPTRSSPWSGRPSSRSASSPRSSRGIPASSAGASSSGDRCQLSVLDCQFSVGTAESDNGQPRTDNSSKRTGMSTRAVERSTRYRTASLVTLAVLGTIAALYLMKAILIPIALALVLACLLSPATSLLRRRLPLSPTGAAVVLFLLTLLWACIWPRLTAESLVQATTSLPQDIARVSGQASRHMSDLQRDKPSLRFILPEPGTIDKLGDRNSALLYESLTYGLADLSGWVAQGLIVLILVLFLLAESEMLTPKVIRFFARNPGDAAVGGADLEGSDPADPRVPAGQDPDQPRPGPGVRHLPLAVQGPVPVPARAVRRADQLRPLRGPGPRRGPGRAWSRWRSSSRSATP